MGELSGKNVFVTGHAGFLGRHLSRELARRGANVWCVIDAELLDANFVDKFLSGLNPFDYMFHLAGWNGGIKFNQEQPARIFHDNTIMGLNVLQACMKHSVRKVVSIVASCAYPEFEWVAERNWDGDISAQAKAFMCEEEFLDGPPHDSVACHGYAKRNLQLASKFYREQYGLNAVCVCPTTLFGPGDSIDPQRTKVLMAVVKKVVDAKRNNADSITFWGTGSPMREFLYVEDAAKLITQAAMDYNDSSMPLNLGTGQEFSIRELVEKVVAAVGYEGSVNWDSSQPDGQMRKRLVLDRMTRILGPFTPTPFDEALKKTIDWYTHEPVPKSV